MSPKQLNLLAIVAQKLDKAPSVRLSKWSSTELASTTISDCFTVKDFEASCGVSDHPSISEINPTVKQSLATATVPPRANAGSVRPAEHGDVLDFFGNRCSEQNQKGPQGWR